MSKKRKYEIPSLKLDEATRTNVTDIMKRMVDSPKSELVEVHHEELGVHQTYPGVHKKQAAAHQDSVALHQTELVAVNSLPVVEVRNPVVEGRPSTKQALVEGKESTEKIVAVHQETVDARKKDRHAKDRVKWSGRFKPDVWQRISDFCYQHNQMEKLYFFELAAVHYIDAVEVHHSAAVEGETPHDDLDLKIYKTHEDIIKVYCNLTGNAWKPADDRAACQFNSTDRRILELGLLHTILNFKGKKINSFNYFKPEIEFTIDEMRSAKLTDETIEIMLRRRREQVKAKLEANKEPSKK